MFWRQNMFWRLTALVFHRLVRHWYLVGWSNQASSMPGQALTRPDLHETWLVGVEATLIGGGGRVLFSRAITCRHSSDASSLKCGDDFRDASRVCFIVAQLAFLPPPPVNHAWGHQIDCWRNVNQVNQCKPSEPRRGISLGKQAKEPCFSKQTNRL